MFKKSLCLYSASPGEKTHKINTAIVTYKHKDEVKTSRHARVNLCEHVQFFYTSRGNFKLNYVEP